MYASLTYEQKMTIAKKFHQAKSQGYGIEEAIIISAQDTLGLTIDEWNSKVGRNAFAATITVLVVAGHIQLKSAID